MNCVDLEETTSNYINNKKAVLTQNAMKKGISPENNHNKTANHIHKLCVREFGKKG